MGGHLINGEFQSDKYPTTPRGKVPLSVSDPTAQDLLWLYAQRRRSVDAEFSADLETALLAAGYRGHIARTISVPDCAAEELAMRVLEATDWPSTVAMVEASMSRPLPPFDVAWARMEAKGYDYGSDALEQVRFGYELARDALALPPAASKDKP